MHTVPARAPGRIRIKPLVTSRIRCARQLAHREKRLLERIHSLAPTRSLLFLLVPAIPPLVVIPLRLFRRPGKPNLDQTFPGVLPDGLPGCWGRSASGSLCLAGCARLGGYGRSRRLRLGSGTGFAPWAGPGRRFQFQFQFFQNFLEGEGGGSSTTMVRLLLEYHSTGPDSKPQTRRIA